MDALCGIVILSGDETSYIGHQRALREMINFHKRSVCLKNSLGSVIFGCVMPLFGLVGSEAQSVTLSNGLLQLFCGARARWCCRAVDGERQAYQVVILG